MKTGLIILCALCLGVGSIVNCTIVNCTIEVTIDPTAGDCSLTNQTLADKTCNDLQHVLLSITANETTHGPLECIKVVVLPGNYTITEFIHIDANVLLSGIPPVLVTFDFHDKFDPTKTENPVYIFSFANSGCIEIRQIDFQHSPGIIAFDNVTDVRIEDCSFRYFFQGAVDLYNCHKVTVSNCTFEHNGPVSIVKKEEYRGHGGGLSLGYHNSIDIPEPMVHVVGCSFRNNTSDPLANIVQSTSQLFEKFVFTGRGGGCAITINPVFSISASFEDCFFMENFARSFGGGLYVGFNGYDNHTVVVRRVRFVKNRTPGAAGGLEIGYVQGAGEGDTNKIFVYDSEFFENHAANGGGVYLFSPGPVRSDGQLSNFAHFENCTFQNNIADEFGAAIGLISLLSFRNSEKIIPMEIVSCNFFDNNGGRGGAVSSAYLPLKFDGDITFESNRGRTMVIIGSHIQIHGHMWFSENNGLGLDGGALYVTSFGQLELFAGADMVFQGNKGVLGASVVVETHTGVPEVYSRLLLNPLCVFLYEDPSQRPDEWENVSMTFQGNKAVVGSSVYTNNIDLCSWIGSTTFDANQAFRWDFVKFNGDQNTAHAPSDHDSTWFVQTPAIDLHVTNTNVSAYPGEPFELYVKTFDELNRPTAAFIRMQSEGKFIFDPAVITLDQLQFSTINTTFYTLNMGEVAENITVETVLDELSRDDSLHLTSSATCPPGYVVSPAPVQSALYTTCECHTDNPDILDCDGRRIFLQDGLWGATQGMADSLTTYQCPSQYCRCIFTTISGLTRCKFIYDDSDPDSQCSCDREGVLCGDCKDGAGVSALLNQCVSCNDASGLLIAALIIVDALLFVGLLLLKQPFPSLLYPCVFYIQILPYLTEHFSLTFEKIHPYLYYVSSALSFYFVYDFCLYSNMSALVSYFLRYLPLFVASVICITAGLLRRYYTSHIFRKISYGMSWIVILMYTQVVHTSLSILNCPRLPGQSGNAVPRWYINGNVECFNQGHAALGPLAILMLGYVLLFIPLALVYSQGWLQRPGWLRRSFKPLKKAFKEKYQWWCSVELGRRVLLLLFIISFPGNEFPAIFVLSVIIAVYGFVQPYKDLASNIIETVLSLNVLLLLLLQNTELIVDELQNVKVPEQPSVETANVTNQCSNEINGITDLTWLLMPFYYSPLVVSVLVATVWVMIRIRQEILKRFYDLTVLPVEDFTHSPEISMQATTSTVLDVQALQAEYSLSETS